MTRLRADATLLTAAFLWGGAFVAQRLAEGVVPPLGFVAEATPPDLARG